MIHPLVLSGVESHIPFDVEPLSFEKSCVVRYWIIHIVRSRITADDSELLDFIPSVLKVGEWRLRISFLPI